VLAVDVEIEDVCWPDELGRWPRSGPA